MNDEPDIDAGLGPRRTEAATRASASKPRTPAQIDAFEKAKAARAAKRARAQAIANGTQLPDEDPVAASPPAESHAALPIVPWPEPQSKASPQVDGSERFDPDASVDASTDGTVTTLRQRRAVKAEKPVAYVEPLPEKTPAPAKKPLLDRVINELKKAGGLDHE